MPNLIDIDKEIEALLANLEQAKTQAKALDVYLYLLGVKARALNPRLSYVASHMQVSRLYDDLVGHLEVSPDDKIGFRSQLQLLHDKLFLPDRKGPQRTFWDHLDDT